MTFQLKRQASGAFALHHQESRETMHPGRGPWEEANALYVLGAGLADLLAGVDGGQGREVVVFDVGLGGAANALAAVACHEQLRRHGGPVRPLRLVSFENDLAAPRFALAHAEQLGYLLGHEQPLEALLQEGRWRGDGEVEWELRLGDFTRLIEDEPRRADVVFFDPFSTRTNPAMWSLRALESIYHCRRPGGEMRLVTYSTSYSTRCGLLLAGFYVGEAGGRGKGTEAATYFSTLEKPLDPRWLQRWKRDRAPWPSQTPPGEYRRLREALAGHPQWGQFASGQFNSGQSAPDFVAGASPPRQDKSFRPRRGKPDRRPPHHPRVKI